MDIPSLGTKFSLLYPQVAYNNFHIFHIFSPFTLVIFSILYHFVQIHQLGHIKRPSLALCSSFRSNVQIESWSFGEVLATAVGNTPVAPVATLGRDSEWKVAPRHHKRFFFLPWETESPDKSGLSNSKKNTIFSCKHLWNLRWNEMNTSPRQMDGVWTLISHSVAEKLHYSHRPWENGANPPAAEVSESQESQESDTQGTSTVPAGMDSISMSLGKNSGAWETSTATHRTN